MIRRRHGHGATGNVADDRFTVIAESKMQDLTGYAFAATAELTEDETIIALQN